MRSGVEEGCAVRPRLYSLRKRRISKNSPDFICLHLVEKILLSVSSFQ